MPKVVPLMKDEQVLIQWSDSPFRYENIVRIRIPMDGSCFFHSLAKAYYIPYRLGKIQNKELDRKQFIKEWRHELAQKLGEPVDPKNPTGLRYYDILSRGTFAKNSESVPELKLEYMQTELSSDTPVSNHYNEFLSDLLNVDIYLLDLQKEDVYITGNDDDILYKGRPSIVIGYMEDYGHYELLGILDQQANHIKTLFQPESPFILAIRDRMQLLREHALVKEMKESMKEKKKSLKK